ncbi:MAG: SPOR domain-containing protein [Pseudomonadota bacterium]
MTGPFSTSLRLRSSTLLAGIACLALAGCETMPDFLSPAEGTGAEVTRAAQTTTLVERDVEAPEVFQVSEAGLWDGRPSLGGVWVAHPTVDEPERVIIRNDANGSFVIGALFRKERETPGPALQVSSDAAEALGVLAGAPTVLDVTALRREEIEEALPGSDGATDAEPAVATLPDSADVETMELDSDPTIMAAAAAIEAAAPAAPANPELVAAAPAPQPMPGAGAITPAAADTTPAPAPRPSTGRPASPLEKPFIQIGIFSVEGNARRTADLMRSSGIIPTVYDQESRGKRFWRVVVGPVNTTGDRAEVLKTVKSLGFTDAYFVTN